MKLLEHLLTIFFTFKVTLKINKIISYSDTCNIRDCNSCKMDQENK